MKKLRMLTVLTLPALASPTLAADKVELIKGLLKRDSASTTQMLSVKNMTICWSGPTVLPSKTYRPV
jgi:hypothetical protein